MKSRTAVSLLILCVLALTTPAMAGGKYHRGYHHGHGHGHGHGHYKYNDDAIIIGAAIIGGSILASTLLSQPRYPYAPRYAVAPRARVCEQDEVYRFLPDGRIQWGTRTRCY